MDSSPDSGQVAASDLWRLWELETAENHSIEWRSWPGSVKPKETRRGWARNLPGEGTDWAGPWQAARRVHGRCEEAGVSTGLYLKGNVPHGAAHKEGQLRQRKRQGCHSSAEITVASALKTHILVCLFRHFKGRFRNITHLSWEREAVVVKPQAVELDLSSDSAGNYLATVSISSTADFFICYL